LGPITCKLDLAIASFAIMMQMDYLDSWPALEKNHSATSYNASGALQQFTSQDKAFLHL
jgi:hypothetical protein